ncbi:MAG: hypothetical protein IEMM0002_0552 [bacterium]|nr:MAG: hypothetical protein IEMM0002_0552 [bacterium]
MTIVSFPGSEWNPQLETILKKYMVGGLIFFGGNIVGELSLVKKLNRKIKKTALSKSPGWPAFITVDEEGGSVSRLKGLIGEFPSQKAAALSKTQKDFKKTVSGLYGGVSRLGFNVTWSPVLDIDTNPNNPVIGDRAFSDNPEAVSSFGKMAIEQARKAGLYTAVKHFPGHGDTVVDSHKTLPVVKTDMQKMKERELRPFRMAVREKVDFIMTAHILFQKVDPAYPVTFSEKFIKKMLRNDMGFKGLVVSDDLNMGAAANRYPLDERIMLAVNAGVDILLIRADYAETVEFLETFHTLLSKGDISQSRMRESLNRIEKIKSRAL